MDWSSDQFSCWEILHQTFASTKLEIHALTRNTVREMESAYWNFEHNISICAMRACKCQISSPIDVKKSLIHFYKLKHFVTLIHFSNTLWELGPAYWKFTQNISTSTLQWGRRLNLFPPTFILKWFWSVMIDICKDDVNPQCTFERGSLKFPKNL